MKTVRDDRAGLAGDTMTRFIEGEARNQPVLFPERLDDWITEKNRVRAVDAFVEELNLQKLLDRDRVKTRSSWTLKRNVHTLWA